jgi:hypothetical protein
MYTIYMSRARDWTHPVTGEVFWFDAYDSEASVEQLELVAEMEGKDLDDVLDERLSVRAVLFRLNDSSGLIPTEIIEEKRKQRATHREPLVCRFHENPEECEGILTRHHFVPKWLMLELPDYAEFAPRSYCTIPACAGWHRFLHLRSNGGNKSIAPYLTDAEKEIANHLIASLRQERPKIYALLAAGDRSSYEWQLVHDFRRGLFDVQSMGKEPFPRWRVRLESPSGAYSSMP